MASDYYMMRLGADGPAKLRSISTASPDYQERVKRGQRSDPDRVVLPPTSEGFRDVRFSNDGASIIWKQPAGSAPYVTGATKFDHAGIRAHIAANPDDWSVGDQP